MRDIGEMVSRGHLLENDFSTININRSQISSQLTSTSEAIRVEFLVFATSVSLFSALIC